MTDADALARRYFALWTEYLTALAADPQTAELLQRWIALAAQFMPSADERHGQQFPPWPPTPAGAAGSASAAAAAAGASAERSDAMGELARRVDELERRLAAVERKPRHAAGARRPRRGDRAGRS